MSVDSRRSVLAFLAALYTLSGLTSLAYEVLWVRMLSQQFGVSIFGVVITVAAFMAGLGAGSWLGERWRGRLPPLLVFGLLEAGVAVYALCLPWLMHYLAHELAGLAALLSLPLWYGLQAVVVLLILFVPACALGIGFPLILRAAAGMILPVGRLYGLNTLGACAGALLPLVLLPTVGWEMSVRYVAGLGVMVGLTAMLLAGSFGTAVAIPLGREGPRLPVSDLLAYAGIGAAGLACTACCCCVRNMC